MPGLAGGCAGGRREDGGTSLSDWVQGDAGADGGRGASRGDSSGGGGESSHTGEEGPGGRKETGEGKCYRKEEEGQATAAGGGRSDGGQRLQATEVRRVEGQGGRGVCNQGRVLGDMQTKGLGGSRSSEAVEVRDDMLPCPRGEGPGWRAGEEAYLWDARTGQILNQDGTPTRNKAAVAVEEERIKDREATGASADICAGTQPMGPVYRHRKKHA